MGLGDNPEEWDSLTVEFFASDSNRWETVWNFPGSDNDTFKQVYLHVSDERFLNDEFQFRFKNYASLPKTQFSTDKNGNVDHWHLDYVYLDTARSSEVTAINDVAMISPMPSLLKNYEAIPWKHFRKARLTELKPTLEINYRNNDTTVRNVTRILKITDVAYPESVDSINGGAVNVSPGIINTFNFPFNYPFILYDADSVVFEMLSYLVTEDLDYKWNDTVRRFQEFCNYYAYDDGSAENGYGLRGEGTANASVAYRFSTFEKDTLRGVKMYFNRTHGDATQDYFRLGVWEHDQSTDAPGELIYNSEPVLPEYEDELNKFVTYRIDDTLMVISGTYYVGWIKTTERILNVGFDRNINNKDKIYYNMGQGWVNSTFSGSLMIRPIMGRALPTDPAPVGTEEASETILRLYPNPASAHFYLDLPDAMDREEWSVTLYNLQGKTVYKKWADYQHQIGHLPDGIYILRLDQHGILRASRKLMIAR
jgi:hypothetical protein